MLKKSFPVEWLSRIGIFNKKRLLKWIKREISPAERRKKMEVGTTSIQISVKDMRYVEELADKNSKKKSDMLHEIIQAYKAVIQL